MIGLVAVTLLNFFARSVTHAVSAHCNVSLVYVIIGHTVNLILKVSRVDRERACQVGHGIKDRQALTSPRPPFLDTN